MDHSTPGPPVHHQLPEFTQTHVHWVSDAIQPSHPLLSPSLPALNLSQHQGISFWNCLKLKKNLFDPPLVDSLDVEHIDMEGWPNFYWCSLCLHVNLGYCIVFFHLKLKESVILFFAYWEMSEILLHILLLPRSALYYIGSMASCKDWNTFGPERLLCFIFWRVIFLGIEFLAEIFRFRTYIPTTVLISIVLNEKSVVSLIAEPMYCDRWLLNCCFQSILMVFFKKKLYFLLCWVFIAALGLSLVAVRGGYSLVWCVSFPLQWLLLLQSTGSGCTGFSSCCTRDQ